jgi:hypothetical protein
MMDSYGCISSFLASDVPELTITEGLRNLGPSDGNCVEHVWVSNHGAVWGSVSRFYQCEAGITNTFKHHSGIIRAPQSHLFRVSP